MSEIQIKNKSSKLAVGAIALVVALTMTACTSNTATSDTATSSPEVKATENAMPTSAYKDGEYTADGDYTSPGGQEMLGVTLTLKNNIITDAKVEEKASLPNSVKFQKVFADNFKDMVVGKNISEVKLDKVSGSSLTPIGFNQAVEKIKSQAKS